MEATTGSNEPAQDSGEGAEVVEVPLKERVGDLALVLYERYDRVRDGEPDLSTVADEVYDLVAKAIVKKTNERGRFALSRPALMAHVWPDVGPEWWAEHEDPEAAEATYVHLDGQIWRMLDDSADGLIQTRLGDVADNGSTPYVLCRTKALPNKAQGVYITRDLACMLEDCSGPQKEKIAREARKLAHNLAMMIHRVPAHATRLNKELTEGMRLALDGGKAIVAPALEAAKQERLFDDEDEAAEVAEAEVVG